MTEEGKGKQPSEASGERRQRRRKGGRSHVFKVTLDDDQNEALLVRAKAAGVSRQRYVVDAALSPEARTVPERRATAGQFSVVLRELKAIGNNVNQLAMVGNSTGGVPAGASDALASIARLEERLADAIDGLR